MTEAARLAEFAVDEASARDLALSLGLALGGDGASFADAGHTTKGLFSYLPPTGNSAPAPAPYDASEEHECGAEPTGKDWGWSCEVCGEYSDEGGARMRYSCRAGCDWHMCGECWEARQATHSAPQASRHGMAFFGTGGTAAQMTTQVLPAGLYRVKRLVAAKASAPAPAPAPAAPPAPVAAPASPGVDASPATPPEPEPPVSPRRASAPPAVASLPSKANAPVATAGTARPVPTVPVPAHEPGLRKGRRGAPAPRACPRQARPCASRRADALRARDTAARGRRGGLGHQAHSAEPGMGVRPGHGCDREPPRSQGPGARQRRRRRCARRARCSWRRRGAHHGAADRAAILRGAAPVAV